MTVALGACTSEPANLGTPPPPPLQAPQLKTPAANAYVGSIFAAGALRPTFSWDPSESDRVEAISYQLQISTEASFTAFVTTIPTTALSYKPAVDLPAARTVPVGARYYWRVRACIDEMCSPYSPPRALNLGRSDRDVNGDGIADIVVAAPTYGSDAAGRVYVYFGGMEKTFDTVPDGTLIAPSAKDFFGTSVAVAGDINGDGFADIVVGAYQANGETGAAYVYLGGPEPAFDGIADETFRGAVPGDHFGISVASAGDVNGDGFADIVVGASGADGGTGAAYVYFGGLGGISASRVLSGKSTGDPFSAYFGLFVSSVGDVDGDGYGDLAVVVNSASSKPAYVYFGDSAGALGATALLYGHGIGPVVGAGDVNGDGFADILIGNPERSVGGGAVYLHFGNSQRILLVDADVTFSQPDPGFGSSVAAVGDVNGDGFTDIIVGMDEHYQGSTGGANLYLGGPQGFDTIADGSLAGMAGQLDQWIVTTVGDVNGDGLADVVVGGLSILNSNVFQGLVSVYLGRAINPFAALAYGTLTDKNTPPVGEFGTAVAR